MWLSIFLQSLHCWVGPDPMKETYFWMEDQSAMTCTPTLNTGAKMPSLCVGLKISQPNLPHSSENIHASYNKERTLFRMLGYPNGSFTSKSHFGNVPNNFIMNKLQCEGTELDIRYKILFKVFASPTNTALHCTALQTFHCMFIRGQTLCQNNRQLIGMSLIGLARQAKNRNYLPSDEFWFRFFNI